MDAIMSSTGSNNAAITEESSQRIKQKSLNGDDFLKLLTVQLSNQNPMEPMEDLDFISQMSSFSSLEQMKELRTSLDGYLQEQKIMGAQNYLGKTVTVQKPGAEEISGRVSTVSQGESGSIYVTINGKIFDSSTVKEVTAN